MREDGGGGHNNELIDSVVIVCFSAVRKRGDAQAQSTIPYLYGGRPREIVPELAALPFLPLFSSPFFLLFSFSPGHLLDALSDRIPDTEAGTYTRVGLINPINERIATVDRFPIPLTLLCALLVARHGQLSFSVSLFLFWSVRMTFRLGCSGN